MSMSTKSYELCKGALKGEELFTIDGSENWRSTPDDLEERESGAKCANKYRRRLNSIMERIDELMRHSTVSEPIMLERVAAQSQYRRTTFDELHVRNLHGFCTV